MAKKMNGNWGKSSPPPKVELFHWFSVAHFGVFGIRWKQRSTHPALELDCFLGILLMLYEFNRDPGDPYDGLLWSLWSLSIIMVYFDPLYNWVVFSSPTNPRAKQQNSVAPGGFGPPCAKYRRGHFRRGLLENHRRGIFGRLIFIYEYIYEYIYLYIYMSIYLFVYIYIYKPRPLKQ